MSKPTPLQRLVRELHDIAGGDAHRRAQIGACLSGLAGERIYFSRYELHRAQAVQFARGLLDAGASRTEVRDRLLAGRYARSATVAYRVIAEAVNARFNALE